MEQAASPPASDGNDRPRHYGKFVDAGPSEDGSKIAVVFETSDGHQVELACAAADFVDAILAFQTAVAQAWDRRRARGIRR